MFGYLWYTGYQRPNLYLNFGFTTFWFSYLLFNCQIYFIQTVFCYSTDVLWTYFWCLCLYDSRWFSYSMFVFLFVSFLSVSFFGILKVCCALSLVYISVSFWVTFVISYKIDHYKRFVKVKCINHKNIYSVIILQLCNNDRKYKDIM